MGILGNYLPNWLPDDPDQKAAMRQGLLGFGAAMLNGRGDFGGILGDGLMAGSQMYHGTLQQRQKDQVEQAQLKLLQNKDARDQRMYSEISSIFGDGSAPEAPTPPAAQGGAVGAFIQGTAAGTSGAPWRPGIGPSSGFPYGAGPRVPTPSGAGTTGADILPVSKLPRKLAPGEHSKDVPPSQVRTGAQFPMTLNQVARLKALGGPDMMDAYKVANEGFKRDQGATYVMPDGSQQYYARLDPGQVQNQDGTISNAVGYVDAASEVEEAKARAKASAEAEYDLLDPAKYIGEDGRPIGGTRGSYIRSVRDLPKKQPGGPVKLPPVRARGPANFPTISPEEQQDRDADRLQILQDELAATTNPGDRAALEREIAGVTRTLSRGAGAATGGAPRLQSPAEARAQIGAVDTNVKLGQDLNSNWITQTHNPVQAAGQAARATLGQIETLKNINFKGGWGALQRATAANMLATLGVKDAEKFATSAQQFQQVAMERNMTMLQAQSGPQTDGDSLRAQQTFVQLSNTPEANAFIAALTAANARIAAQKADYYLKALPLARQRGDMTEIDRRWARIAPSVWSDPGLAKYNKGK